MKILLLICSLVIITIWLLWEFKWEAIRVSGISMLPTLKDGDIVLIDKRAKLRLGDIVVLTPPDNTYLVVKRITKIRTEVNHTLYWVVGDNRNHSHDSRDYGWVEEAKIEGRVIKSWKTKKQ